MTEPPAPNSDSDPAVSESLTIRRAAVADAGTVRALMVELADYEGTASAVRSTVEDWRRMLASPGVLVLLAYVGDQPVGYLSGTRQLNLWIGGDIFAMDDLYVRAGARDHGVGGHLMAALAEHVDDDQLVVTWGAREDNEAGHRFYRRIGASLRRKVVASWSPNQYAEYLGRPR